MRRLIREIGRIPAQRNTSYDILKVYDTETAEDELDRADASQFGSYFELVKLDKYRYKNPRAS
jgi:FO synthase subunit 2